MESPKQYDYDWQKHQQVARRKSRKQLRERLNHEQRVIRLAAREELNRRRFADNMIELYAVIGCPYDDRQAVAHLEEVEIYEAETEEWDSQFVCITESGLILDDADKNYHPAFFVADDQGQWIGEWETLDTENYVRALYDDSIWVMRQNPVANYLKCIRRQFTPVRTLPEARGEAYLLMDVNDTILVKASDILASVANLNPRPENDIFFHLADHWSYLAITSYLDQAIKVAGKRFK